MNWTLRTIIVALGVVFATGVISSAAVIDFTGGTATLVGGGTGVTTPGNELFSPVDYYVENGFKLDFINTSGGGGYVGDYYGTDTTGQYNDVIHGHWAPNHGDLTSIEITKVGGGTFDLNYFILTSNTQVGGDGATGLERAYINAWVGGIITYSQLLPPESWGWFQGTNPQINLGSQFDAVDKVSFSVTNDVYCFGMDMFYIDEPAPNVPEPSTLIIWSLLGISAVGLRRWQKRKAA